MHFGKLGAIGTLALGLSSAAAFAQYPDRPINMIIPYGPGGATDISARTLAAPLGKLVGQPLIMTNVAGAGGAIGATRVKNAKPNGYTLLFSRVGTHSVNPAMKATLPYKVSDFTNIAVYEINPVACAVRPNSGINSMADLIAQVRKGGVSYSSSGVGSLLQLAAVMVLKDFGIKNPLTQATHIPQKGGGAAAVAVLNGTATFICTNSSALSSFVANGQLKPILVTTDKPVVGFDAPTAASLGKPELSQLVGWTGLSGPKDLPASIVKKWSGWIAKAAADPKFVKSMEARGSTIRYMGPKEAQKFIYRQYKTFRALVDELGMRVKG